MTPEQEAEQQRIWDAQDEIKRKLREGKITQAQAVEQRKEVDKWLKAFQTRVVGRPSDGMGNGV